MRKLIWLLHPISFNMGSRPPGEGKYGSLEHSAPLGARANRGHYSLWIRSSAIAWHFFSKTYIPNASSWTWAAVTQVVQLYIQWYSLAKSTVISRLLLIVRPLCLRQLSDCAGGSASVTAAIVMSIAPWYWGSLTFLKIYGPICSCQSCVVTI